MRSSNCWHWKLLSYHVSPNNWFVALNVPVKLQPFPVNDCCACVSLFVSRILSSFLINWFETDLKCQSYIHTRIRSHMCTNTNHLRYKFIRIRVLDAPNQQKCYLGMTLTTFNINKNSSCEVFARLNCTQKHSHGHKYTNTHSYRLSRVLTYAQRMHTID